jgi:hypothetical protein
MNWNRSISGKGRDANQSPAGSSRAGGLPGYLDRGAAGPVKNRSMAEELTGEGSGVERRGEATGADGESARCPVHGPEPDRAEAVVD